MSTPLFNETVMAVGLNLPTFEPAPTHEDFLRRHEFLKWLDDTFAAAAKVTADKPRKPRARRPKPEEPAP
jgi:hypothetical protein